jgi:pyroglutamyl-peptidase
MAKKILVTGFEPFGGDAFNPSQAVVQALDGRRVAGRTVVGGVLPCVFGRANAELRRLLRRHRPELVVCLGLAASRGEITPERVAINVDDARIPDNAGAQPVDRPIVRGGPAAYFSTLPVKAIVAALHAAGHRAGVSQTAGTFVCNHVFYGLMRALARRRGTRGGFVHVPAVALRDGGPDAAELARLTAAVEIVLAASVRNRRDLRRGGGQTD